MVYFRNAMLKIIVQIMCHTHRNSLKYVAHQYTMYISTMSRHEVILSRTEPRERKQPTYCGWHLQLEGFPNLSQDEIWVTQKNLTTKEIVKVYHVPYLDFCCAIFCKTEWFLSVTNPEQPLYLQLSSGLQQTRCVPITSRQIWLWEISLPVFAITLLS